ncbi:spindle pole body component 110-like [Vespula squamosa]|uniref:Spindle pole body component 110-like n=1 Tax=Vespula squamosa TaxID=30214 RepID=A0ABD2ATQ0_VESSQ
MSYVEHGPRVFFTGRQNNSIPLAYGDYIVPKKRLEGRLKVYESCSDIRAWSSNPLETSQYFRELAEHTTPSGKIIPFNVVIENIIGLTSQAQNELQILRKELKKYKSLKLTNEQEIHLRTYDDKIITNYQKEKQNKNKTILKASLKDNFKIVNKSISLPHLDSYLSIQINSEKNIQYNDRYYRGLSLFDHMDSLSGKTTYLLPKLKSIYFTSKNDNDKRNKHINAETDTLTNLENKYTQVACVEYSDISVQVIWDVNETETQTDCLTEYTTSSETKISLNKTESQISTYKYDYKNNHGIKKRKINTPMEKHIKKDSSIESYHSESLSESTSITESEFDIEFYEKSHKEIIIQKDSEIIALKNEFGAKEAEVEELKEINKNLGIMLKKKDENLNTLRGGLKVKFNFILQERSVKLNKQRKNEMDEMRKKLYTNMHIIEQLKIELNKKYDVSFLQSQEIEKLRLHVKDTAVVLAERDSLMEKVKEMEHLSKEAENCRLALDQLREAIREKDELQKQNLEQKCILNDQEDEIKRLLILIQQTSSTHNDQQNRMTNILEELQTEIIEKDNTISKYEEQLHCMEQEINNFTTKLKSSLNNLEEFKIAYEDICSRVKCDHDTCERTKRTLYTVMEELQKSKLEHKEPLEQIENVKKYSKGSLCSSHLNYHFISSSSNSEVDESNIMMFKKIQTSQKDLFDNIQLHSAETENINNTLMNEYIDFENHSNKDTSEPDSWNSAKTEVSILSTNNNVNIENTIVEEVSKSLIKMQSLMKQLQIYAEDERPSLIKQIQKLYKYLMDNKSVIVWSPDKNIKRQQIYELYNKYKQNYEKHNPCTISSYKELQKTLINEELLNIHDEYIDKIFTIQFKRSITKMNELSTALQGVGDEHTKIVKEVVEKQQKILEKDTEIAQLKEKVRMGEGDCIRPEKSEWDVIKENFRALDIELNQKNQLIKDLQDTLILNNIKLSAYITECDELKFKNKNLIDNKNSLLKECSTRSDELKEKCEEINQLVKQLQNLNESIMITNNMEREIEQLKTKLNLLQEENSKLRKKLTDTNEIIWKNNELIRDLKDKQENDQHNFASKVLSYDTLLAERQNMINNLENTNLFINERLKDAEKKILSLNKTITELNERNNEMKMLDILHDDVSIVENNITKLETKSSKYKLELLNYENINKQNELRLATFTKENQIIQKHIEILKEKLSVNLTQEIITDDELKHKLQYLPNELYNKIMNLKNKVNIYDDAHTRIKYNLHQNVDKDSKVEKYKSKQTEKKDTIEDLWKIQNLIDEVEKKDFEIENFKNRVNNLSQENDDLYKKLKLHKEDYEDKLTILKKKYDSSISALHKKHTENIEHLKMNFEEINGEKIIFDSESWLQSLSIKELTNVHNRIYSLMNKSDINNDHINQKTIVNVIDKEDIYEALDKLPNICDNDKKENPSMETQHKEIKLQEEKTQIVKTHNINLKDHNSSKALLNLQKHSLHNKDKNEIKEENILHNIVWERTMFFDPTSHKKKYNKYNLIPGLQDNKKYANRDITSISTNRATKKNTIDWQRKNFIYQCSVHHKKSNIC